MHHLKQIILEEFQTLSFAREAFPMMADWGVEDYSLTIHSLGCNYLSALGRHLGHWAMSEYPVKMVRKGAGETLRPDVVWWSQSAGNVCLLGEFERFDPTQPQKMVNKAKHLLHVHRELEEAPRILLLMAWTLIGTDLGHLQKVRSIGHDGFQTPNGATIRGVGASSAFILATALFTRSNGMLKLQRIVS